jgi:hypothetical protein
MSMTPVGMGPSNHALAINPSPGNAAEWSNSREENRRPGSPDGWRGPFERKAETPPCAQAPSGGRDPEVEVPPRVGLV